MSEFYIEKGEHGYNVLSDGETYGTAMSEHDAKERADYLERIGQAYSLLSQLSEDFDVTHHGQISDAAETCREAVWELRNLVLGTGAEDLKLLNALIKARKR